MIITRGYGAGPQQLIAQGYGESGAVATVTITPGSPSPAWRSTPMLLRPLEPRKRAVQISARLPVLVAFRATVSVGHPLRAALLVETQLLSTPQVLRLRPVAAAQLGRPLSAILSADVSFHAHLGYEPVEDLQLLGLDQGIELIGELEREW